MTHAWAATMLAAKATPAPLAQDRAAVYSNLNILSAGDERTLIQRNVGA
jgi:hypothetical protein